MFFMLCETARQESGRSILWNPFSLKLTGITTFLLYDLKSNICILNTQKYLLNTCVYSYFILLLLA